MTIKVLVIEDEALLRREVVQWLTLEDYDAFEAADGIEGVNQAFQHQPDLIICDITMPRLDGHGVLLELRSHPSTAATPFIFVTARASHEDVRRGMDLGADDYISKPFTRLELLGAIQARLEKKAAFEHKQQDQIALLESALAQEHDQRMLKAKLVAMFSHDFRNPLASILASNSLLRNYRDRLSHDRQELHFGRVEDAVRQLIQMLDDMLMIARMETGHLDFTPQRLNPEQFFQKLIDEFQTIHEATHHLIYICHFKGDIEADPALLRQIASNLISNAIKYSPKESEVHISVQIVDKEMIFAVQDHGIGIPETDQTSLFQSFQRASNVSGLPGTGLGLAIIQQAVELHRGSIRLDSQVGVGTTVTVRIPIVSFQV